MKKARFIVLTVILLCNGCVTIPPDQQKQEEPQKEILISPELDEQYQYTKTVKKPIKLEITTTPSFGSWAIDRGKLEQLQMVKVSSQVIQVDLRAFDLRHLKIGKEQLSDLKWASFSTTTKWPPNLPKEFNPVNILEEGKNPGLQVRTLHEQGITGTGISIAIIDQNLTVSHKEYKEQLKFYEEINVSNSEASMHGPAVASIAVGKTVGVAPEADLYYIGQFNINQVGGIYEEDYTWLALSIDRILEVNKILPDNQKIRVISISSGWDSQDKGYYETVNAVNRAIEQGIFVVSASLQDTYGYQLHGLGRSWYSDADDSAAYTPGLGWSKSFYRDEYANYPNILMVPMDGRTTADPSGNEGYTYYSDGGLSWAIPYVAGLYALACQVKQDITPREFWNVAIKSGDIVNIEKDGKTYKLQRIVNPVKLIAFLKQQ